jgi:hypothetical protein
MTMIELLHQMVLWTARGSLVLFLLSLAARSLAWSAWRLWAAFIIVHTIHFAFVAWYVVANEGRGVFPNNTSLDDGGGWPLIFGSGTFFYGLVTIGLIERRAGERAGLVRRMVSAIATTMLGLMFIATYWPPSGSGGFRAIPIIATSAALAVYLVSLRRSLVAAP